MRKDIAKILDIAHFLISSRKSIHICNALSHAGRITCMYNASDFLAEQIQSKLEWCFTYEGYVKLKTGSCPESEDMRQLRLQWLEAIIKANMTNGVFPEAPFHKE